MTSIMGSSSSMATDSAVETSEESSKKPSWKSEVLMSRKREASELLPAAMMRGLVQVILARGIPKGKEGEGVFFCVLS